MSVEDHQAALPFQKTHKLRYTQAWRDTYQHMYVIRACIRFHYLDTLLFTQLSQYLPDICF
jgi:hypothetical protein